jgi:hypothetical protein
MMASRRLWSIRIESSVGSGSFSGVAGFSARGARADSFGMSAGLGTRSADARAGAVARDGSGLVLAVATGAGFAVWGGVRTGGCAGFVAAGGVIA